MNLEDRKIEDIDNQEEYEMVPFEPMMYGYGQMNMKPSMGMSPNMNMYEDMGMNPSMDMDPNRGYTEDVDSNMEMNPLLGMNPWMSMMYEDASMQDLSEEGESLRQLDNYGDNEPFKDGYNNPNKFNPKYNDVDSIVRRIERYNPAIFRLLTRYGMPFAEARGIVRRIVRLTLMYSEG